MVIVTETRRKSPVRVLVVSAVLCLSVIPNLLSDDPFSLGMFARIRFGLGLAIVQFVALAWILRRVGRAIEWASNRVPQPTRTWLVGLTKRRAFAWIVGVVAIPLALGFMVLAVAAFFGFILGPMLTASSLHAAKEVHRLGSPVNGGNLVGPHCIVFEDAHHFISIGWEEQSMMDVGDPRVSATSRWSLDPERETMATHRVSGCDGTGWNADGSTLWLMDRRRLTLIDPPLRDPTGRTLPKVEGHLRGGSACQSANGWVVAQLLDTPDGATVRLDSGTEATPRWASLARPTKITDVALDRQCRWLSVVSGVGAELYPLDEIRWQTDSGAFAEQPTAQITFGRGAVAARFTSEDRVVTVYPRRAEVWSIPTGQRLAEFAFEGVYDRAAAAGGRLAVRTFGEWGPKVEVWAWASGRLVERYPGGTGLIAIDPSGRRLATRMAGGVRVWEIPEEAADE